MRQKKQKNYLALESERLANADVEFDRYDVSFPGKLRILVKEVDLDPENEKKIFLAGYTKVGRDSRKKNAIAFEIASEVVYENWRKYVTENS